MNIQYFQILHVIFAVVYLYTLCKQTGNIDRLATAWLVSGLLAVGQFAVKINVGFGWVKIG